VDEESKHFQHWKDSALPQDFLRRNKCNQKYAAMTHLASDTLGTTSRNLSANVRQICLVAD